MWLQVGTRGDWRVIYVIIIGLLCFGLRLGYESLFDLNNGQENLKIIVQEITKVEYFDSSVKGQTRIMDEHIGGGREIIDTLFYDLPAEKNEIHNKIINNIKNNDWQEDKKADHFRKNNMSMYVVFMEPTEYEHIKHMKGKIAWKIKMEIK